MADKPAETKPEEEVKPAAEGGAAEKEEGGEGENQWRWPEVVVVVCSHCIS